MRQRQAAAVHHEVVKDAPRARDRRLRGGCGNLRGLRPMPCPLPGVGRQRNDAAAFRHQTIPVDRVPASPQLAERHEGVRVIAGHSEATAIKGRAHQKRILPV